MPKIAITLDSGSGELDRLTIAVEDAESVTRDVIDAIEAEGWMLSAGDTIQIIEIE